MKPPWRCAPNSLKLGKSADDIRAITIRTHEACLRIIDKKGPLANPADRDHCVQYMVAIPLLFGRLTAADYEDEVAADPRIDALRAKIACVEEPAFTADYHDPDKRSIANSLRAELERRHRPGRNSRVPHRPPPPPRRRTAAASREIQDQPAPPLHRKQQQKQILDVSLDRKRLESMPVNEYVDLYVP